MTNPCDKCKHKKVAEEKDPCHGCLSEPANWGG